MSHPAGVKRVKVVGALVERDGNILLTQRLEHQSHGGYWEFPGGKVRDREAAQEALAREIREELGIGISVGERFMTVCHQYEEFTIELEIYRCAIGRQQPLCREIARYAWVEPEALAGYALSPADIPVAERLASEARSHRLKTKVREAAVKQ